MRVIQTDPATNLLFYDRTNERRKLDPEHDPKLVVVWQYCRDEIMIQRANGGLRRQSFAGVSRTIFRLPARAVEIVSEGVQAAYDVWQPNRKKKPTRIIQES